MKKYDPFLQYQSSLVPMPPSFFRRALAFILDISILSFTVFAPLSIFFERFVPIADISTTYTSLVHDQKISTLLTILMLFIFTLVLLYFSMLEYIVGQTAGKRMIGIKVEDIYGNRPSFWQCLIRNLVLLPIFPFILFWIIDPLFLLISKQRLSEQLSRTRTVNVMNKVHEIT